MDRETLRWRAAVTALLLFIWTILAIGQPWARLGNRFQVALPVTAVACSATRGALGETAARFVGSLIVVHGLRNGLGNVAINRRPNGKPRVRRGHAPRRIWMRLRRSVIPRVTTGLVSSRMLARLSPKPGHI